MNEEKTRWDALYEVYENLPTGKMALVRKSFSEARKQCPEVNQDDVDWALEIGH